MPPDTLPANLRSRILVCDGPHPRLGSPCWVWAAPLPARPLSPACQWRRCCNPGHATPAAFLTTTANQGVQAHA